MEINYDDFGVCTNCKTVNSKNINECRNCGLNVKMKSIGAASESEHIGCIFWILIFLVAIFTGGIIGAVIGFFIGSIIFNASSNRSKAKENQYKNQVLSFLEQQASEQKSLVETQEDMAKQAFELGNYEKAITHYKNSIEQGDNRKSSLVGLAISYYNFSDYSSAIPLLDELVTDSEIGDSIREVLVRAIILKGNINNSEKDTLLREEAYFEGELKKSIILTLAEYYHRNQNDPDIRATEVLATAIVFEPNNSKHFESIVELLNIEGRYEEALMYIERLDEIYFTPILWEKYANILFEVNDTSEKAIYVFEKYLEYRQEDTDFRIRLGQILIRNNQLEKAIKVYETGLITDTKNIKLRHQLALTYSLANQINNSIKELQVIMKLPQYESYLSKSAIHILLGKCFIKKDMLQMALTQFLLADRTEEALEHLYDLGELFTEEGDLINAKKCWEEIFASDVMFRDVSQKIG